MEWLNNHPWLLVIGMVVVVLAIPCKYDPAIRLKEWQMRWRDRIDKKTYPAEDRHPMTDAPCVLKRKDDDS